MARYIRNIRQHRLPASLALLAAALSMVGGVHASTVSGWWGGDWKCSIDSRPARMRWVPVSTNSGSCDGDGTCSSASGARWSGRFSDNGARWVDLSDARPGKQGGLFFRHADGNQWYLAKPEGNRSTGWTTWNGSRYPLSCWR